MSISAPACGHVPVLDPLRGLAALSVCLFHFVAASGLFPERSWILTVCAQGRHGVEAFFVISGFVLPLSLYGRGYCLRQFWPYLWRRIKRIEPPYFASIALALILMWVGSHVPGYRGPVFVFEWGQFAAHFGYLAGLAGFDWYSAVYWSLAIEFQFYLVLGLIYPIIGTARGCRAVAMIVVWAASGLLAPSWDEHASPHLLHWFPLFALGMATFLRFIGNLSIYQYGLSLASTLGLSLATVGLPGTVAAGLVCVIIQVVGAKPLPRVFDPIVKLGTFSFSLYLIHMLVGGRIISLATRLPPSWAVRLGALALALAASISAAWVFYRLVERPSQRWAQSRSPNGMRSLHAEASERR
jgi:peptidoglycan/LPS O-acetylase OafA/YrhL